MTPFTKPGLNKIGQNEGYLRKVLIETTETLPMCGDEEVEFFCVHCVPRKVRLH